MTDEQNNLPQLPKSWVWTRIGDIGTVAAGGTPSTHDPENFDGDIHWITPADLSDFNGKFISRGKRNLSEKGLNSSSARLLPTGTVLFSSRAPIGYVAIAANPISTNQGFKNLTCHEGIFNEYVFYYLKASKALAESYGSGTTFREVSASRFAKIPFPLPPFPEQRRIVAKVEELFTNLDAGIESLRKVKAQLKHYRQAVLKYAFEGKLTEEWRKTHNGSIEPASVILELIRKQSKKEEQSSQKIVAKSPSDLYELPENWAWSCFDDVVTFITDYQANGSFSSLRENVKRYSSKNYAVLVRLKDLRNNMKNVDEFVYTDMHGYNFLKKTSLKGGELLVANVGANTGTAVMMPRIDIPATLAPNMFLVVTSEKICKKYFFYISNSQLYWREIERVAGGTGQPKMNKDEYRSIRFPLAPLAEQQGIVEEIERHFSIIDETERTVERCQEQARLLKSSILKITFEGKLVPQDLSEEPAEKLLERIKAERAKSKAEKDTNKKKNTLRQLELSTYVK